MREMAKDKVGVVEIAAVGDGAKGDYLSSGKGIGKGSRDGEMGLDLHDLGHGEEALFQERESSLA